MRLPTVVITAVLALSSAVAVAGEVYKWKDKDGRVHYGDRPKTGEAAPVLINPDAQGTPNEQFASRQAQEAECNKKRTQLDVYRRAPSISEVDNLGKTREYTKEEREQFLALTQKKVDELCAPREPSREAAGTFPPPEAPPEPVEPPPEEEPAE